jgi:hypothetical protein
MAQIQPAKTYGLVLSASTLKGDKVVNHQGEDLGKIEEIMIDLDQGGSPTPYCRSAVFWVWVTNCLPFPGRPFLSTRPRKG